MSEHIDVPLGEAITLLVSSCARTLDRVDALEAENKRLAEAIRVPGDLYIHGSLTPPHYIHGTQADGKRYPMDRLRTLFGLKREGEHE